MIPSAVQRERGETERETDPLGADKRTHFTANGYCFQFAIFNLLYELFNLYLPRCCLITLYSVQYVLVA